MLDQTDATAASQNALPTARYVRTQWRQHTHTGDHDASTRHRTLLSSIDETLPYSKKKPHAKGSAVSPGQQLRLQNLTPGGQ
jgi:hypothetical protein